MPSKLHELSMHVQGRKETAAALAAFKDRPTDGPLDFLEEQGASSGLEEDDEAAVMDAEEAEVAGDMKGGEDERAVAMDIGEDEEAVEDVKTGTEMGGVVKSEGMSLHASAAKAQPGNTMSDQKQEEQGPLEDERAVPGSEVSPAKLHSVGHAGAVVAAEVVAHSAAMAGKGKAIAGTDNTLPGMASPRAPAAGAATTAGAGAAGDRAGVSPKALGKGDWDVRPRVLLLQVRGQTGSASSACSWGYVSMQLDVCVYVCMQLGAYACSHSKIPS